MGQKGRGAGVVSFGELRQGRIGLFFATVHCRIALPGPAVWRGPEPGHCLRQGPGGVGLLPDHGIQWRPAPDPQPLGTRIASGGMGPQPLLRAAGIRAEHGRIRPHRQPGTGSRVVGPGPPRGQPLPLRREHLFPRHGRPGRADSASPCAASGPGGGGNDPGREPPGGAGLLGSPGPVRRPGHRHPQLLPGALSGRPPAERPADPGPGEPRRRHRSGPRRMDALTALERRGPGQQPSSAWRP